jgi:hypothetical protein
VGYTHYWHRPKELDSETFKLFVDDVRKIIHRITNEEWHGKKLDIMIRGGNGKGVPEVTNEIVSFNGDAETGKASEKFYINRLEKNDTSGSKLMDRKEDGTYFRYCKTNLEPYDLVVVASLIAFKYRFGDKVKVKFATGKLEDLRDEILLAEDILGPLDANFIESLIKKDN